MTAVPDSERRTRYSPVVPTARFNVGFVIYDAADVTVYIDGIERGTGDADYPWSVSATFTDGEADSAQVVASGSGWSGVTVDIVGKIPPSRIDEFADGGGIPAADLNLILNRIVAALREGYDRRQRGLVVAFGEEVSIPLPAAVDRAGMALSFDDDGQPTVSDLVGDAGEKGWSPVFAVVSDSARRVLQVSDWTGGEGTKPTTGLYVGATGLTAVLASAVDIRGAQGASGAGTGDLLAANNLSDLDDIPTARTNLGLGAMALKATVGTSDLDNGAVTSVKITDANVTEAKIATGAVTATKIGANAVANTALATMAAYTLKGRKTGSTGNPEDFTIASLTEKTAVVAADKVLISDSEASGALKFAQKSNLISGGSFTEAENTQPTSNTSSITKTGLSAYKLVKIAGALQCDSDDAAIVLRARVSAGSWRTILTTALFGGGATAPFVAIFSIEIANFNAAQEKIITAVVGNGNTSALDSSNAANGATGVAAPCTFATWDEIWDEIEIAPSVGTFQGNTADQRGRVLIYGSA